MDFQLISVSFAPILIILTYIFIRDKYEKEPIPLLTKGVFIGILITIPIVYFENILMNFTPTTPVSSALYTSFIVAAFTEELFKYLALYLLIWRNKNFNEPFDGIVYSVFISLGFALVENVLYVFSPSLGGIRTGFSRGIFSVPAHAFFGVNMGYYFALAKFRPEKSAFYKFVALLSPILLHGMYDFILFLAKPYWLITFIIFVVVLWANGFAKINRHLLNSPFRYEKYYTK